MGSSSSLVNHTPDGSASVQAPWRGSSYSKIPLSCVPKLSRTFLHIQISFCWDNGKAVTVLPDRSVAGNSPRLEPFGESFHPDAECFQVDLPDTVCPPPFPCSVIPGSRAAVRCRAPGWWGRRRTAGQGEGWGGLLVAGGAVCPDSRMPSTGNDRRRVKSVRYFLLSPADKADRASSIVENGACTECRAPLSGVKAICKPFFLLPEGLPGKGRRTVLSDKISSC